jgi:flagella basal body P-ring formation protein FlgA
MRSLRAILYFIVVCTIQFLIVVHGVGAPAPAARPVLAHAVAAQLPSGARVEVGDVSSYAKIPAGARVSLVAPNPPLGLVSFTATWLEEGRFHSTNGTALVRAYAPVAITRAPLRPGDAFNESNVRFEERELTPFAQSGYFLDWDQLRATRVKGFARAGMVLGTANTELPAAVRQGEWADLVRATGALRVVAKVRVLDNGKIDQSVRVQNPATNRILLARVSGPGELQLR